ncbi:hypothetical protein DFP94_11485 [Fontibacillus phaseoli]|uniref:Uncharacterized protein n=1 Tax=Fontibacillus phaseoli TaxID=1416533 RepID=A0A369B501_9BACL|nr:hypothetical protein [Fontibacillus phaseoli]RCX15637.1 hypothetical protein DFP94_11485 [Fontibacillus phaseoli]
MKEITKYDIIISTTEEVKREQLFAALVNIIEKYAEFKQTKE